METSRRSGNCEGTIPEVCMWSRTLPKVENWSGNLPEVRSGRGTLPEVRSDRGTLPKFRKWSVDSPGGPKLVGDPSRRSGSGGGTLP